LATAKSIEAGADAASLPIKETMALFDFLTAIKGVDRFEYTRMAVGYMIWMIGTKLVVDRYGRPLPTRKPKDLDLAHSEEVIRSHDSYDKISKLSDEDLIESVINPSEGNFVTINANTQKVVEGNTRVFELQQRGIDIDVPFQYHYPNHSKYFYDLD
jgi:hypothetical protein